MLSRYRDPINSSVTFRNGVYFKLMLRNIAGIVNRRLQHCNSRGSRGTWGLSSFSSALSIYQNHTYAACGWCPIPSSGQVGLAAKCPLSASPDIIDRKTLELRTEGG